MKISIPIPCHESWDDMIPEEKGRFCLNCQKVVIDFSNMTDNEIINYFQSHKNEKICGQFQKGQLQKSYVWAKPTPMVLWYKKAAAILLLTIMTSGFSSCHSQNTKETSSMHSKRLLGDTIYLPLQEKIQMGKWAGIVRDDIGNPISQAQILIKSQNLTIFTDENGFFEIDKTNNMPEELEGSVQKSNYSPSPILLNSQNLGRKISITLYNKEMLKGEVRIKK